MDVTLALLAEGGSSLFLPQFFILLGVTVILIALTVVTAALTRSRLRQRDRVVAAATLEASAFLQQINLPEDLRQEWVEAVTVGLGTADDVAGELEARLAALERRLPKEATLSLIADVNDAILATKLEALEESVKQLRESMVSKWGVAVVVFAILAALGALLGAIFGILAYLKP